MTQQGAVFHDAAPNQLLSVEEGRNNWERNVLPGREASSDSCFQGV